MVRQGRDLEILVALLEDRLGPEGVGVKSPDWIVGKHSGSPREVDVSLRSRVGSSEVLIVVECRDRQHSEDVRWIEQLATKREDVGADKAVAVSSSGFSCGAVNMATAKNVELRILSEVDVEEFRAWLRFEEVNLLKNRAVITHVLAVPSVPATGFGIDQIEALKQLIGVETPAFIRRRDCERLSVKDIWQRVKLQPELFSGMWSGPARVRRRIRLEASDEHGGFQVMTTAGPIDLDFLEFDAQLWRDEESLPPARGRVYQDGDKILSRTVEFEFELTGTELALGFHRVEDSEEEFVTIRLKAVPKVKCLPPECCR